jgi:hypothetical protein
VAAASLVVAATAVATRVAGVMVVAAGAVQAAVVAARAAAAREAEDTEVAAMVAAAMAVAAATVGNSAAVTLVVRGGMRAGPNGLARAAGVEVVALAGAVVAAPAVVWEVAAWAALDLAQGVAATG